MFTLNTPATDRFSVSIKTFKAMKRQLSIKELIDCKFGQFAEKDAFLMFIQDECEVRSVCKEKVRASRSMGGSD